MGNTHVQPSNVLPHWDREEWKVMYMHLADAHIKIQHHKFARRIG